MYFMIIMEHIRIIKFKKIKSRIYLKEYISVKENVICQDLP